jgi:hypothetical protein
MLANGCPGEVCVTRALKDDTPLAGVAFGTASGFDHWASISMQFGGTCKLAINTNSPKFGDIRSFVGLLGAAVRFVGLSTPRTLTLGTVSFSRSATVTACDSRNRTNKMFDGSSPDQHVKQLLS